MDNFANIIKTSELCISQVSELCVYRTPLISLQQLETKAMAAQAFAIFFQSASIPIPTFSQRCERGRVGGRAANQR